MTLMKKIKVRRRYPRKLADGSTSRIAQLAERDGATQADWRATIFFVALDVNQSALKVVEACVGRSAPDNSSNFLNNR